MAKALSKDIYFNDRIGQFTAGRVVVYVDHLEQMWIGHVLRFGLNSAREVCVWCDFANESELRMIHPRNLELL